MNVLYSILPPYHTLSPEPEPTTPDVLAIDRAEPYIAIFLRKVSEVKNMKYTFGNGEGECCLESHPPTQARTTSRHPPPRMKGSTAHAHRNDATAAQAESSEAAANHWGCSIFIFIF